MWKWLTQLACPKYFFGWARIGSKWFMAIGLCCAVVGLYLAFFVAPPDFQQGDAYRLMYIHVPAAIISMASFAAMAVMGVIYLIWRIKLCDVIATSILPVGLCFTLLTLVSGSIWGKPMWGTWWIWDARLTSELILAFLYLGVLGCRQTITDLHQAAVVAGMVAVLGAVDLPIIHYSVTWWHTLHQGPSLLVFKKPSIAGVMLWPLLFMICSMFCYTVSLVLKRSCTVLLQRQYHCQWVKTWLLEGKVC